MNRDDFAALAFVASSFCMAGSILFGSDLLSDYISLSQRTASGHEYLPLLISGMTLSMLSCAGLICSLLHIAWSKPSICRTISIVMALAFAIIAMLSGAVAG